MAKTKKPIKKNQQGTCEKCGRKYDFSPKVTIIKCACGAEVFKPENKKISKKKRNNKTKKK